VLLVLPVYSKSSFSILIKPTKVTASPLLLVAAVDPSEALVKSERALLALVVYLINSLPIFTVPLEGKPEEFATGIEALVAVKSAEVVVAAVSKSEALVRTIADVIESLIPVAKVV